MKSVIDIALLIVSQALHESDAENIATSSDTAVSEAYNTGTVWTGWCTIFSPVGCTEIHKKSSNFGKIHIWR